MGACRPGCTEAQILKLKKILDDCIVEVSGLQQPAHSNSEKEDQRNETEYMQGYTRIRKMVRDIAMALTGETIRFSHEETDAEEQARLDREFEKVLDEEEDRNPHHGEEDDYPLNDEYVAEDTVKVTSQDLLDAVDKIINDPRIQRALSFGKSILDDAKENLK